MVVLATKVTVHGQSREQALDGLRSLVTNTIGDLDVDWDVGVRHDDFPTVSVDGEDKIVARNALREEWGEITDEFTDGERYVGTLQSWDDDGFVLDAGREIRIPTSELGLGQGRPAQLVERFGLVQHLPMKFVYGSGDDPSKLASEERDRLYEWPRGAGRVNVNNATRGEVRATVNRAGHAGDIVTVERLGLLEQSVICKEETDPPGLLAAIGPHLTSELRCVIPS
jgi:hypothetical protein